MFGDSASKLIKELKRAPADCIPQHNTDLVNQIQREIKYMYSNIAAILQRQQERRIQESSSMDETENNNSLQFTTFDITFMNIGQSVIQRNKRCLLAYHYHRMNRIKQIVWEMRADGGGCKPAPRAVREQLSASEQVFYREYCRAVMGYKLMFEDLQLDISGPCVPPTDLYIKVRAVRQVEFVDDGGVPRKIMAGQQEFVRRQVVERFIEQGYLIHVV